MVDIFQEDLKELRDEIESIDEQIVKLLSDRKKITDDIVKHKASHQTRAFSPLVEDTVLEERKRFAQKNDIDPDFVTDLFRLVLFDGYQRSCTSLTKVIKGEEIRQIVIIGDTDPISSLMHELFSRTGYSCLVAANIEELNQELIDRTDVIFVAEPLEPVWESLKSQFQVSTSTLIVNLNNVNTESMDFLATHYAGPGLGLHPMFSPANSSLTKQVMYVCHGNMPTRYVWLIEQFKMWGLSIIQSSSSEHDHLMLIKSSLNHFFILLHALELVEQGIELDTLLSSTGPNYRLALMNLGKYFHHPKQLKLPMLFRAESIQLFKRCSDDMNTLINILETGDHASLDKLVDKIQHWFGEQASEFDDESNRLSRLQPLSRINESFEL